MNKINFIIFITIFILYSSCRTKEDNKIKSAPNFNSKSLIQEYFNTTDFITDSIARYKNDDEYFEVAFEEVVSYSTNGKDYSLVFFGHYPLYSIDNVLTRVNSTATIGNATFSIIKFEKINHEWLYRNQWHDLETGCNVFDKTFIPKIVQIENYTFLELPDIVFWAGGSHNKFTEIYNTENFKKSFEIITMNYQADDDVDGFIASMNKDKYNEKSEILMEGEEPLYVGHWSSENYKIKYSIQNSELFIIVDRIFSEFNKNIKQFVKKSSTEKYKYDKASLKFIKVN